MRRRGIRRFCHGVDSTSTDADADAASSSFLTVLTSSSVGVPESEAASGTGGGGEPAVTLEQMILQLDLEEAAARKAQRVAQHQQQPRRASCVNSSDRVLRSARDALSQYPRFSLDGRDAMYRASFSDYYDGMGLASLAPRCGGASAGGGRCAAGDGGYEMDLERTLRMPATVAGESVVWCKPGVVAKLMGLEAVPVPVRGGGRRGSGGRRKASGPPPSAAGIGGGGGRKRRVRRTGREEELEKERLFMALHSYDVAGMGACHAGALHPSVGPNVSGIGKGGEDEWEFRLPRGN